MKIYTKNDFIVYDTETDHGYSFCGFKHNDDYYNFNHLCKNSVKEMLEFLKDFEDKIFIGFNNYFYDNYILNYVINHKHNQNITYEEVRNLSNTIISKTKSDYKNFINPYNKTTFQVKNQTLSNSVDLYTDFYKKYGGLKKCAFFINNHCFKKSLKSIKNLEEFFEYNKEDLDQTQLLITDDIMLQLACVDYLNKIFKTDFVSLRDICNHYVYKVVQLNPMFDIYDCLLNAGIGDDSIKLCMQMIKNKSFINPKIEQEILELETPIKHSKTLIDEKKEEVKNEINDVKNLEKIGFVDKKNKTLEMLRIYKKSLEKKEESENCSLVKNYNNFVKRNEDLSKKLDHNLNGIYQDGINIKYGGLHHPPKEQEKNWSYYENVFYGDFASYYPNIYLKYLDFLSKKDRGFLNKVLEYRLKFKKEGKIVEATSLKLFLNSLFGKMKGLKCEEYPNITMNDYVCLFGQFLAIDFLRSHNITTKDIIELNTDGFIIKEQDCDYELEHIGIESGYIKNLYHKSSNIKYFEKGDSVEVKGGFFNNTNSNNIFSIPNLDNIFKDKPVYNSFFIQSKKQGKGSGFKIKGEEKPSGDIIFCKIADLSILDDLDVSKIEVLSNPFSKTELEKFFEEGKIVEITEFNFEDISKNIKNLWKKFKKVVDNKI